MPSLSLPDMLTANSDATTPLAQLLHLPTLDETYGALLLGSFVGLLLYGVVVHQAYRYIQMYKDDHLVNKLTVLSLIVIDTAHCIACIHSCYVYLVSSYSDPLALLYGIWSIQCQPLLAGLAVLVSQSFFARRVYIISEKYRFLVVISLLLTFVTFGFSIAGTVVAFKLHIFTQYEHYYWMDSAACAAAVAADALTTSVLTITLRQSRTGYRHTDTLIDRLVLYTINTGLLTGIANCSALVFAIARPDTFIWIGIEIVAMRLYSNSVLALLNSRRSLRAPAGSNNLELSTRALYGSDDLPGGSGSQKSANLRTLERATTVLRLPEATTSSGHL
ncbi:hypothetical protein BD310DRAFT_941401 [Dichomitus squalens]|uniref:DUF6534 domain-containing protein n=1 Tax=Dichomitus squalens TaxID=114155 RepID=A0A4Q9PFT2_9APHY|nr:hypothetical protein BD310DRAFT_941401 [Dichomitus squalens]